MDKPISKTLELLKKEYGVRPISKPVGRQGVFQILISTILSQNCSDTNSERAAIRLFDKYRKPESIVKAPIMELEKLIKSSGFYKVKARRIKEVSRIILEDYSGKVPDSIEELVKLPGIGRKTAGCVVVYGYAKTEGIPVDTHVHRLSNRLGWVKTKQREKTEVELLKIVPKKYWVLVNELFVLHGKNVCIARNPHCWECPVNKYCLYYNSIYKEPGKKGKLKRTQKTMLNRIRND